MYERLARWWAHRKLGRGRCYTCKRVLPDNAVRYCSTDCATSAIW